MLSRRGLGRCVRGVERHCHQHLDGGPRSSPLKAQRATVGAPGSRAGLRMARLSASTVDCAVDGLGRWSVGAKRRCSRHSTILP